MDRRVGRHRMEKGDIVNMLREMWKEGRDLLATLPVGGELPLRPHDPSLALLAAAPLRLHLDRLAVEVVELRLVIEGIDMARAAIHEQEDHALRLGGEVGNLRGQRISPGLDAVGGPRLSGKEAAIEEPREGKPGKRCPRFPEELAAGAAAEAGAGIMVRCHALDPLQSR